MEATTKTDGISHKVIQEQGSTLRSTFDRALGPEIRNVCEALDYTIQEEARADALLLTLSDQAKEQRAHCLALTRKTINDIFGAVEMLRSGYYDLSQGVLRGVIEGFCTAILIHTDTEIYKQYLEMRYSVNTSVDKACRRQDLGFAPAQAASMKAVYEKLHNLTHPTILAVATQFPLLEAGFPIGGTFDAAKIDYYRMHLGHLRVMALNIAGFLQERCGRSIIPETRHSP